MLQQTNKQTNKTLLLIPALGECCLTEAQKKYPGFGLTGTIKQSSFFDSL